MENKDSRLIIVSNYFTREHTLYVFEDSNCKEEIKVTIEDLENAALGLISKYNLKKVFMNAPQAYVDKFRTDMNTQFALGLNVIKI